MMKIEEGAENVRQTLDKIVADWKMDEDMTFTAKSFSNETPPSEFLLFLKKGCDLDPKYLSDLAALIAVSPKTITQWMASAVKSGVFIVRKRQSFDSLLSIIKQIVALMNIVEESSASEPEEPIIKEETEEQPKRGSLRFSKRTMSIRCVPSQKDLIASLESRVHELECELSLQKAKVSHLQRLLETCPHCSHPSQEALFDPVPRDRSHRMRMKQEVPIKQESLASNPQGDKTHNEERETNERVSHTEEPGQTRVEAEVSCVREGADPTVIKSEKVSATRPYEINRDLFASVNVVRASEMERKRRRVAQGQGKTAENDMEDVQGASNVAATAPSARVSEVPVKQETEEESQAGTAHVKREVEEAEAAEREIEEEEAEEREEEIGEEPMEDVETEVKIEQEEKVKITEIAADVERMEREADVAELEEDKENIQVEVKSEGVLASGAVLSSPMAGEKEVHQLKRELEAPVIAPARTSKKQKQIAPTVPRIEQKEERATDPLGELFANVPSADEYRGKSVSELKKMAIDSGMTEQQLRGMSRATLVTRIKESKGKEGGKEKEAPVRTSLYKRLTNRQKKTVPETAPTSASNASNSVPNPAANVRENARVSGKVVRRSVRKPADGVADPLANWKFSYIKNIYDFINFIKKKPSAITDPFEILGFDTKNTRPTEKQIVAAYRRLALVLHPDKYESDKELANEWFAKLNWAKGVAVKFGSGMSFAPSANTQSSYPSSQELVKKVIPPNSVLSIQVSANQFMSPKSFVWNFTFTASCTIPVSQNASFLCVKWLPSPVNNFGSQVLNNIKYVKLDKMVSQISLNLTGGNYDASSYQIQLCYAMKNPSAVSKSPYGAHDFLHGPVSSWLVSFKQGIFKTWSAELKYIGC